MIDFDKIDDLQNQLEVMKRAVLHHRGWHNTSSTPDSVWMWEKTHDGKTYSVSMDRALSMERNGIWV
jgi:hypothetical protein